MPHGQPAEGQVADVLVRQPQELHQAPGETVSGQKQPGSAAPVALRRGCRRYALRGVPPERREQDRSFQQGLVQLGGMPANAVHHEGPRSAARFAPQFAVDEIPDAPGAQADRHQGNYKIGHLDKGAAVLSGEQQHCRAHSQQAAVKGHAAFPDAHDIQRVVKYLLPAVEQQVAQAPARNDAQAAIEDQVLDHQRREGAAGPAASAVGQPPGGDEAQHVRQAVPSDGQRPDAQRDGIESGIFDHILCSLAQPLPLPAIERLNGISRKRGRPRPRRRTGCTPLHGTAWEGGLPALHEGRMPSLPARVPWASAQRGRGEYSQGAFGLFPAWC